MFVKLSTGEAGVWVQFGAEPDGRRNTQITFEYQDRRDYGLSQQVRFAAKVCCSKRDNFCRRIGRKLALNKLLWGHPNGPAHKWTGTPYRSQPASWLTKEDRQTLWQAICPEFFRVRQSWEEMEAEQAIIPHEENAWSHPEIGGES